MHRVVITCIVLIRAPRILPGAMFHGYEFCTPEGQVGQAGFPVYGPRAPSSVVLSKFTSVASCSLRSLGSCPLFHFNRKRLAHLLSQASSV